MKKTLCWLIVLAMLVAMAPAVFATEGAATIEDGQYIISYGEYTYQALGEDKSYGYAPAGTTAEPTEADYITITNVGDGQFTMTDCYGRTIYMSGTYNSFNVGTDVTEGHLWTLEEVEGGYYVKNVLKEKYISYSASYGTWGSYGEPGDNSVLTLTAVGGEEETETVTLLEETVTFETYEDAWLGEEFYVNAPGNGTVTVTFDGNAEFLLCVIRANGDEDGMWYNPSWGDAMTQSVEVTEGEQIKLTVCTLNEACDDYAAGEVSFTMTFAGVVTETDSGEEGGEDTGDSTVLAVGDNVLSIEAGVADSAEYTFTATEAGTLNLVIHGLRLNTINDTAFVDWDGDVTTEFPLMLSVNGEAVEGNTASVEVAAGDVVTVTLTQNRMYVNGGYGWEADMTIDFAPVEVPVDPDVPSTGDHDILELGDNVIELPMGATESVTYIFTATETGTLYFAAVEFYYVSEWSDGQYEDNSEYMDEWAMYTSFTVNGEELEGAYYGSVDVVAGETYTITWEFIEDCSYGYQAVMNLSYSDENIPVPGIDMDLLPTDLPMYTVEIPAGEKVLYQLSWEFSGLHLLVYGENAYVEFMGWNMETFMQEEVRIDAVDGVVTYAYDDYYAQEIYIGNAGDTAVSFELKAYAPEGSEQNPIILESLDDLHATGEPNEDIRVYYQWTATQDDVIVFTPDPTYSVNVSFWNETAESSGEWNEDWTKIRIPVSAGDVISIYVSGWSETGVDYKLDYYFESVGEGGEAEIIAEGEITVETTDTYTWVDLYSITALATGSYTFYIPAGLGVWSYDSFMSWGQPEIDFYNNTEGYALVVDLTEGEEFSFYVGAITKEEWVITYTCTAGSEGGEEGGDEPVIEAIDLVIGNNSINAEDIAFQYTATEAGTLVLNLGTAIMGPVEGVVTVNGENAQNLYTMGQIELALNEGDVVLVVFTASGYATMTAEWTAGSSAGGGEVEGTDLVIGNNQINAEDVTFVYTATEAGTLKLAMGGAVMGDVEATVTLNGEAVGALTPNTDIDVEMVADDVVVVTVTAAGYSTLTAEWTADSTGGEEPECEHEYVDGVCVKCGAEDPNYVPTPSEPDGTAGNPFIIETLPATLTGSLSMDGEFWKFTATEDGVIEVVNSEGSVVSVTLNGEYASLPLNVVAGDVVIINPWGFSSGEYEITVSFRAAEAAPGTAGNPIAIDSLNITLTIDDSEIYYAWTAAEAGEIVIRIAETTWGYGYSLTINGETLYGAGSEMTINVEAGDQIIIVIEVYPSASSDGHLTLEQVVEAPHEHNYVITDSKEATCTEEGYVTYTCECGDTYTETVPTTEHSYVDGKCEHCGAADPNPENGSIDVLAIALIAMMSVTAVAVTAKKSDEE